MLVVKFDTKKVNLYLASEEEDGERELSHPVHSDNCMIQDDGTCIPDETAYIQRHYRYGFFEKSVNYNVP